MTEHTRDDEWVPATNSTGGHHVIALSGKQYQMNRVQSHTIYVCMPCQCIHTHTYTCTHTHARTHIHPPTHTYTHTCTHTHARTHTCTPTHTHTYTHTHTNVNKIQPKLSLSLWKFTTITKTRSVWIKCILKLDSSMWVFLIVDWVWFIIDCHYFHEQVKR